MKTIFLVIMSLLIFSACDNDDYESMINQCVEKDGHLYDPIHTEYIGDFYCLTEDGRIIEIYPQ
jgi:hypothetical protein